ncbi:unnamed protein product [Urochloa humidicola]
MSMDIVCEVCGNIGYKHLLVCCRDCKCSAVHRYCMDEIDYDASLPEWWCFECLQKRGEVTSNRSLERVSSQSSPSHAHFGSTVHQQVTRTGAITRARAAAAQGGTPSTSTAPAVVLAMESLVSGPDNIDHIPLRYKNIDDVLWNSRQPWNSTMTTVELCSLERMSHLATKRLQLTKKGRRLLRQKSRLATKRLQVTQNGSP